MNVGICTVYKSTNVGSFLQAYALALTLKRLGCNVVFLNNHSRKPIRMMLSEAKNDIKKGDFSGALYDMRLYMKFIIAQLQLKDMDISKAGELDCVVLGSDEIWNVSRKNMRQFPSFFGVGLGDNIVSYAPSFNNACLEDIQKCEFVYQALRKMTHISVRDNYSHDLVLEICGKDVPVVCDPTWLLNPNEYKTDNRVNRKIHRPYLFMYVYDGNLSDSDIRQIQEFASNEELEIISVNNRYSWVNKVVIASPFEFLSLMRGASCVVTNTFHGTALSILYHKQFASFCYNNRKVYEILDITNLKQNIITEKNSIYSIIANEVDWNEVDEKIEHIKTSSMRYLRLSVLGGYLS